MDDKLILKNRLKEARAELKLSQKLTGGYGWCVSEHDQLHRNRTVQSYSKIGAGSLYCIG